MRGQGCANEHSVLELEKFRGGEFVIEDEGGRKRPSAIDDFGAFKKLKTRQMLYTGFVIVLPLVICQLFTQPVAYYHIPLLSASADSQYVYGETPLYELVYHPSFTQSAYVPQVPYGQYGQPMYQHLQYPVYQNGLSPVLSLPRQTTSVVDYASYMSLINDKENFQTSGCGWDATLVKCTDTLGLCKGGCRDFAVSASAPLHDCRYDPSLIYANAA
ncbi:unnamed protein product [Angiostrongylus costaricensis]|uniref:Transmembrane protein n=1 Tax=Angiostrongylus costaricensis TaxID=334426 RepID=A0A158PG88_ANGCS|nr:unnamed protein product [Angiostrongylus costaricensis]